MRRSLIICLLLILGGLFVSLKAQDSPEVQDSSIVRARQIEAIVNPSSIDTIKIEEGEKNVKLKDSRTFNKPEFKPNPKKAVLYSVMFPGLGQIYNRKYWKLPIIYGGFVGLSYAITWNGNMYSDYSQAYKDIMSGTGTSWYNLLPSTVNPNQILSNPSEMELYKAKFKRRKDFFRRNRDLAIIAAVGLYGLCIIDAYVDAQLFDFDISPDLSMRVDPMVTMPTQTTKTSFGLQCSIRF